LRLEQGDQDKNAEREATPKQQFFHRKTTPCHVLVFAETPGYSIATLKVTCLPESAQGVAFTTVTFP
jgi:hypothetical protein